LGVKSRLVVKDFNDGSTSTDLYAGTPCMSSLRAVLALASWHQNDETEKQEWCVATADISTAFMHASIPEDEVIYIRAPPEMPGTGGDQVIQETAYPERQIWQVLKAMNGLRQSPKLFQEHLAVQLQCLGFQRLVTDTSTYRDPTGRVDLVVHVDDLTLAGPTKQVKNHLAALHTKFAMKTTGLLTKEGDKTSILGRTLERTAKGYLLHSDSKLVASVIKDLGLEQAKPAATPGIKDEPEQAEPLGPEAHRRYRTLVGRLLYMSLDRADIQYAVKELSRQLHAPTEHSMVKLKRLGRYLVGRPTSALRFKVESRPDVLEAWVDGDWVATATRTDGARAAGWCCWAGHRS